MAHGNSLRALVKYLDGISDTDIAALNIPTGIPLVYESDERLKPIRHYYLGDPAAGGADDFRRRQPGPGGEITGRNIDFPHLSCASRERAFRGNHDARALFEGWLVVVGVLFVATSYLLGALIRQEPALSMMLSLYVTLGIFLLLAVRNPGRIAA